jgi:hypothetical protein
MKRFILLVFSILLTFTVAMSQDGINYQGAATDANGDELTNQSISIRASVLSTSANGNLEWEETHSTTTDQFGLFNVVIGQGTNTTNGATATFDEMDWGSANHFIKIEMDATGGTNYAMIGTTQMMSVPYALYAKSAGIDSAMLANMIGSSGGGMGGGCDYKFPEGIGESIAWDLSNGNDYTVPTGKNLFIINVQATIGYYFNIDGKVVLGHNTWGDNGQGPNYAAMLQLPLCVKSGEVVSYTSSNVTIPPSFYGILTDAVVNPISFEFGNAGSGNESYTVPVGKKLVITNVWKYSQNPPLKIDGINILNNLWNENLHYHDEEQQIEIPLIVNSGSVVDLEDNTASFNGYLVDENYFAGCGGGGSSTNSSAQFNNQISNYNNILDESITSGIFNYLSASYPASNSFSYTVPSGKLMKITDASLLNVGSNNPTYVNGVLWNIAMSLPSLLSEGTQIEIVFHETGVFDGNQGDAVFIQYDLIDNTDSIMLNYLSASYPASNSFSYTVPSGKLMKITDASLLNVGSNNPTYVNGVLWNIAMSLPSLLSEGTQIEIVFHETGVFDGNQGDAVFIQYILFDN